MSEICLIHLVWKPLGLEPFRDFITSYRRNSAGVDHRLVVAFNGFDSETDLREYREILAGVVHESFVVSPSTQDLPVYFKAAQKFDDRYFCFLNSYSVILDQGWLAKMHGHLTSEGVGLVGATANYESYYTNLELERGPYSTSRFLLRRLAHDLPLLYKDYRTYANFQPFPNPHVRTNGFMLAREIMLGLRVRRLRTKMDCFKLESGRDGITRQIMRMGLKPLVVGRDGRAYEKEKWFESGTFRSSGQHNLLIADNHTRRYSAADVRAKSVIERISWGSWPVRQPVVDPVAGE
jgi:hypothetical protein